MESLAYASGAEKRRCSTPRRRSSSWLASEPQRDLPVMKNRIGSANDWAVANGAGLGRFPSSARIPGRKIVPLDTNCGGRSIFGAHSVPAAAGIHQIVDWPMEPLEPV
jgi:hypothetical protein